MGSPKKIEEYEWFCPQPFINIHKGIFGQIRPCCIIKETSGWPKTSINEYLNGDKLKTFRKEMLTTPGPEVALNCQTCIEQEKHGNDSHRKTYLGYIEYRKPEIKEELESYLETDMEKPFIKTMEWLAPTNYCNLRCHMCGSGNSSSFAKENQDIGIPLRPYLENRSLYKNDDIAAKDIQEIQDNILDNLVELKLTGGEPLAIKYNYDLLETAVTNFDTHKMDLRITTNATLTPKFNGKNIFDYIPEFKETIINVSIEGWADRNSYIRYPSNWGSIINNVHKFLEMDNVSLIFVTTVNSLSAGYLWEIAKNCEELIEEYPDKFHPFATGSLVHGQWEKYTVSAIPLELRGQYIQNYYENPVDHYQNSRYIRDYMKLISYLENMPFDEKKHKSMMRDIQARDKHRGTNLLDLWPEWSPYYGC